MLGKLRTRHSLGKASAASIIALPFTVRDVDPNDYLARDGEKSEFCSFVVSGFAFRHKLTGNGGRQICSIHIPGDFLDLPGLFLGISDHNIQMLTHGQVAFIPHAAMERLALSDPEVARAVWIDTLVDGSVFREWILNVGRRDARSRIAHLLCEFAVRFEAAGLTDHDGDGFELPMTQEQVADAVGLTPVHVNRTFKALEAEGLISRSRRYVLIESWDAMVAAADFTRRYLHLDRIRHADLVPA